MKKNLLLIVLFFASCGTTPDPVPGTFGFLLDDIFNRAATIIQSAQNAGLMLEVNAGSQVQNTIITAQRAYHDELQTTIGAMTAEQQKLLSDLDGLLNKVKAGSYEVGKQAQQIVLTLPGAERFPQLTAYDGTIVEKKTDSVMLSLKGVFFYSAKKDYENFLKINGKSFQPLSKTNQELQFYIPTTEITFDTTKISYVPFTIDLDYTETNFLIFKSKNKVQFNLYFVALPKKYGTYTLEVVRNVNEEQRVTDYCGPLSWNTHNGHDDGLIRGCSMAEGWICDVNSVKVIDEMGENRKGVDWFDLGNASQPTFVGWHYLATTRHGLFGNYGGVTCRLMFQKYRTVNIRKTIREAPVDINWGDKKVITVDPNDSWKLIFNQFDKKVFEIASSTQLSPYVKVDTKGNQLSISLAPY